MAIIIPHDIILHHVLPKLPIKSSSRFMCVSKDLHSFLSSDRFQKLYDDHHQKHEKFLVLFNDGKEPRTFGTINCEEQDNVLTPSSYKLPAAFKEIKFIASFHGLVCVRVTKKRFYHDLILWNPRTSDWKKLSENKSCWGPPLGLFYSSCEKDYKLVHAGHKIIDIYSLKSDSWRSFAYKGNLDLSGLSQGTCLNENLYFLNDHRSYSVVKFDTKTETFTEMTTSGLYNVEHGHRSTLLIKKGCIYVCVVRVNGVGRDASETEVWKINEGGDWMKMGTYRVDPCNMRYMKPLQLTRNGNLLMLGYKYESSYSNYHCAYHCQGYLYNVDMKKKHRKAKDKDKERLCCEMEISQVVRYTETAVSPNQYIK